MKLFPHQEQALKDTETNGNALYALDMGLGKTFIGSEKMRLIGNTVNLLVCQKSKIPDWVEHFETYYPDWLVNDLTKANMLEGYVSLAGNQPEKMTVGVINYELLFRRNELLNLHGFTLMLDESSLIQNETTKRAKFILKMDYANVILLSGTVVNGNYERLWSQCHLLGWTIPKKLFYAHYVKFETVERDGFKHKVINGYKNIERLKRKLKEYGGVFVKTDEVFELPEQNDIFVYVNPTNEYKQFCKDSVIHLEGRELIGDYQLTKRLCEKMLCAQWNKNKLKAFGDLVSSTDDRLIVFYTYTEELLEMMKLPEVLERRVSIVSGDGTDLEAYRTDPQSITFIQYQAGAMGLNLQEANKIVYFSLPDGWSEGFEQSRKRIHRIGQNRPCFYYILLTRDSIEVSIWRNLGVKKERTDELFKKGNQ